MPIYKPIQDVRIYGKNGGLWKPIGIDGVTNSIQIVNYEHHEIHGGNHYSVVGYQDLSINNVLDFTWLMPDTTKWITLELENKYRIRNTMAGL